ncbi:SSI family serine proteinase inhibitor [Streptomyces sp. NPDC006332]|uniref:SSI family serine proteinase inhibitor n=1 Tax=Streptomyces sp. NPDC006332 TaxID=3155456 RepID=UPI0033B7FC94
MTYTTTAKALRGGLPAAAVLLLTLVTPAQAAPQEAAPGNWLYVSVTTGDARSRESRGTLLMCDPPRGHQRAAEACAQLETTAGDIDALPATDSYCTMVHAPVTAHARGLWNGRPVAYAETFTNACVMKARTGAVFALDS